MKIILGTFKDNGDELAAFLEPRLGAEPVVNAGEVTFDDDKIKKGVRARHVKTYVKRFLNKKGERENYRILVEGPELRLIEFEREEEEEEEKERKMAATEAKEKKERSGAERSAEETKEEAAEEEKEEQSLDEAEVTDQTKPERNPGD